MGIGGGCRREELYNLTTNNVEDTGTQLVVTIPYTKNNQRRVFTVINEMDDINFLELYRRYLSLRPKQLPFNNLFVSYRNGKCTSQRVGIHSIGGTPRKIATYLNLENPEKYTGHCFRRTSVTFLKKYGGWKNSTLTDKYMDNSMQGQQKISHMMQGCENFVKVLQQQSTSTSIPRTPPVLKNAMDDNEKEVARLQKLYEEVPYEEASDDDDDSLADPDSVGISDHDSESEQDMEEENYRYWESNAMDVDDEENKYFVGKDGTRWKQECQTVKVHTKQHNLLSLLPEVKLYVGGVQNPLESWSKFIDDEMLNTIVANTNIYIRKLTATEEYNSRKKETSLVEIKAVIGLLYIAGVKHGNRMNLQELWATDGSGIPIFATAMSISRFRFLLTSLRFDDVHSREERRQVDKLTAVREVFENFVRNCKSAYTISEFTTLDEMLWAFRGRCSFRMYIANKPAKYGLKIFALVDSKTYYVNNLEIYTGIQPDGPYQISNQTDAVVERMCEPIYYTGRNITMDSWFTGFEIMKKMFENYQLTIVGTLRKNKKSIPPEFIASKNREVHSTIFGFSGDITVLSYIPKRNKCVLVASTMHHDNKIDEATGEQKEPEIVSFYNHTKDGVDKADQLCGEYNVARNTRRWPMVVFYGILNIAGINAAIVHNSLKENVDSRRSFLKELGLELVKEHLKDRAGNMRLSKKIRNDARTFAGLPTEENVAVDRNNTRKGCAFCSKRRKSRYYCEKCNKCICLQHAHTVCPDCSEII